MGEPKLEQKIFNPKAYIDELSLGLITYPYANGNPIPTFMDFVQLVSSTKSLPVENFDKEKIDWMRDIYYTVIYSRPVPLTGDPFLHYQNILEDLVATTIEKEKNIDLSAFPVELDGGARFNPGSGEFYDPNNKESDYRKLELKKYLEFKDKNNF